jgi:hypothetical protein
MESTVSLFGAKQNTQARNLADHFPPGTPFRLLEAAQKGLTGEPGAEKRLATITVSAVEAAQLEMQFGVWGSLADQLTQLEAGELPAIVTLTDAAGVWQFAPHGPVGTVEIAQPDGSSEEVPRRVNVEPHMVPDAPTDSPLPSLASEKAAPSAPDVPDGGHRPPVSTDPPSVRPTPIDDAQTFQPGENS